MFKNFIQIAGIIDNKEANMLIECGVEYLGFPLRLPVNKEDLSEDDAIKIISKFQLPTQGVLITYLSNANEIYLLSKKIGVNIIQLHGDITKEELSKLKKIFPKSIIIKSLVVGKHSKDELLNTIDQLEIYVDAFITDSYCPQSGATGATGITHDWEVSKALVNYSQKPIIIAGGLTHKNVYEAIVKVRPAGVDTHTGVEDDSGRKEKTKTALFIKEAKKGFMAIKRFQNDI